METVDRIEFHDSMVQMRQEGTELLLELRPAYVHHWSLVSGRWQGTGRTQVARIRLMDGRAEPVLQLAATEIADGWLRVGEEFYDNLLPVPLSRVGAVSGNLLLANADPVDLFGTAIVVQLVGPPEDVEELPADWAPAPGAV
jgi:hypothetical protein